MKGTQRPGVVFQPRVRRKLQSGIGKMVGAIRPTLGPLASGVAIDPMNTVKRLPEFLDNGGLIARRIIQLRNRDQDLGALGKIDGPQAPTSVLLPNDGDGYAFAHFRA